MDPVNLDELAILLKVLRDNGVTEYTHPHFGHIVLRADVPPTVAPRQDHLPQAHLRKKSAYESALGGRLPSFQAHANAGLVTE